MLEGRILTHDHQEFIRAEFDGVNRSGYEPLDDKVLVLMDEHAPQTTGGILLTEQLAERQTLAAEHGVVVAVGPAAFKFDDTGIRGWVGRVPGPGDRIYCERYAGQLIRGTDARQYRLMSQRCIGAIATEERTDV